MQRIINLVNDSKAPSHARRAVRNALLAWEYDETLTDVTVLLTSELVTNAGRHAQQSLKVVVQLRIEQEELIVEVYDGESTPPVARRPGTEGESGRGLEIVEALTREHGGRCGSRPCQGGKAVFFTLKVPPLPQHIHERELAGTGRTR